MAQKESTFANMVITLLVVTLAASTALGFVYEATKDRIAQVKLEQKKEAIEQVVPQFDNSPLDLQKTIEKDGGQVVCYEAKMGSKTVGVAVETFTNKGFGGMVKIMVGFKPDGTINGITVLEHKETPGLGDKMESGKSEFSQQFVGQIPGNNYRLKVTKDDGDVNAITAATISSRAFCDAVDRAFTIFKSEYIDK